MEEIKLQYPGFKIICEKCNGEEIVIENSMGFSDVSGAWGSIDLVCNKCGNRTEIVES